MSVTAVYGVYGQNKAFKIYVEYAVLKGVNASSEYLIADSNYALYTTDFLEVKND